MIAAIHKNPMTTGTYQMIVLGVHISGLIGCDVKTLSLPRALAQKYFLSEQARQAIKNTIKQAKDNPLQTYRANQIKVQISPVIATAIKTDKIESIFGLKEFLEEIKAETDTLFVIGRSAKEDEVLKI